MLLYRGIGQCQFACEYNSHSLGLSSNSKLQYKAALQKRYYDCSHSVVDSKLSMKSRAITLEFRVVKILDNLAHCNK